MVCWFLHWKRYWSRTVEQEIMLKCNGCSIKRNFLGENVEDCILKPFSYSLFLLPFNSSPSIAMPGIQWTLFLWALKWRICLFPFNSSSQIFCMFTWRKCCQRWIYREPDQISFPDTPHMKNVLLQYQQLFPHRKERLPFQAELWKALPCVKQLCTTTNPQKANGPGNTLLCLGFSSCLKCSTPKHMPWVQQPPGTCELVLREKCIVSYVV